MEFTINDDNRDTVLDINEDTTVQQLLDGGQIAHKRERTYTGITPSDFEKAQLQGLKQVGKINTVFGIPVKEGVTYFNILAIPMVPFTMMLIFTYMSAQVIFLLGNPDYFDVPLNQVGKAASILLFFSFPGAIVGTFMTGYVFDILGRKWTLFISFLLGSILLAVIPQTSPSLTYLLIVRILLQMCFCAPASSPLPADYIHKESIGVGMTLNGVGLVMGQIFSMGVMFKVTQNLGAQDAFCVVAGCSLFLGIIFLFIVREP